MSTKPAKISKRKKLFFAAVCLAGLLGAIEIVLRVVGYEFHLYPTTIQMDHHGVPANDMLGTDLTGQAIVFRNIYRADALLGWSPVPGYRGLVNALGFRGPAVSAEKSSGIVRVACLGDSCTFIGSPTYPQLLQELLGERFEVINAGVSGYSSYQGLLQLQHRLLPLSPDWVTVYFGWNDHWLAHTMPDSRTISNESALYRLLDKVRLGQVVQQALLAAGADQSGGVYRVSLDEYRRNLQGVVDLCKRHGIKVCLMTAPWNVGSAGHAFLTGNGNTVLTLEELQELHARYNDVVREAAKQNAGVSLIDLERIFDKAGRPRLFHGDGIHPNEAGYRVIAEQLSKIVGAGQV